MTKKIDKFHITFVLDRSGSMDSVRDATISGFNEFLGSQRKAEGTCKVTLVQFDDVIETPYSAMDIKWVKDLSRETFVPRNMTSLYDAIGEAIKHTELALSWSKKSVKPLIVILTDGLENSSKKYTQKKINELISKKQEEGWDFVYIGANQDAWAVGTGLGIRGGFTRTYTSNPTETVNLFRGLSASTTNYRYANASGTYAGSANVTYFEPGTMANTSNTTSGNAVSETYVTDEDEE